MSGIYPMQVTIEVVRALGKGATVVTGTLDGVEKLVRELLEMAEITPQVVEHSRTLEGRINFTEYAHFLGYDKDITEVVVIHSDPHSSRVVKAFLAEAESKTRLVTPADLLQ